ncbi:MAG: amino acid adenylation domain-containing protein, partial [bacterium]|nr:amino acid adenylation domain-containing protein [bacterium]
YLKMTPSQFSTVVSSPYFSAGTCRGLRLLVLGGEAINTGDVEKAYGVCGHLQIMNHYGPTEVTIGCISQVIDRDQLETYKNRPTIGKPIYNTGVFILDKYLNLLPVGVTGELCLSGAGVAKGYFKREALTAEKFVNLKLTAIGDVRVYRTGDLARRLGNGNIEFFGRIDHQVKIRGYRIEL